MSRTKIEKRIKELEKIIANADHTGLFGGSVYWAYEELEELEEFLKDADR